MTRGRGQRGQDLIDTCTNLLAEIKPAGVRAVCYQLFVQGEITSMARAETARVSRFLTQAREDSTIPWDWITDETREVEAVSTWDDPAAFARSVTRAYKKDKWAAQPYRVEVWSEKGTIRGSLRPVLTQYEVPFRVMHGFGSATAVHDAADTVDADERQLIILYVGDWDPSGLFMSEKDLQGRLDEYSNSQNFFIKRVALTRLDLRRLPSFNVETKRDDPRHDWFLKEYGRKCWEVDALSPVMLRRRVEDAILDYLDQTIWDRYVIAERVEQASITKAVKLWKDLKQAV